MRRHCLFNRSIRLRIAFICLAVWVYALSPAAFAQNIIERPELDQHFIANKVTGTFVYKRVGGTDIYAVNPKRAARRYIPASTFKITNSLIALETGTIENTEEIIPYGGKPQPIKIWERDMSMRQAIRVSNVPVYQELARRIGLDVYQYWLKKLNYGNGQTGQEVERFWLEGPLAISAIEQIEFVEKLIQTQLPVSPETQTSVVDILKIETNGNRSLFGKTGWTRTPDPDLGWFVGWVKTDKNTYAFALNMDINHSSDAKKRVSLAKQILNDLGLY